LLQESTGTRRGARIELCKRIPLAAGLAGGSSDAAAALVGLNRFWNLGLSSPELHALAARLGSDVNFFLSPTPLARCRGRGEQIEPLRIPLALHFVIARPRTGLATSQVFKHCRPEATAHSATDLVEKLSRGDLGNAGKLLHNSLQTPAEHLNEEVLKLKRTFDRLPFLGHQMSGSGTSYFGLCANRDHASRLAARVRAECPADYFVTAATCSP
jgi:4-diphosphocytidyl-2-C-methyl-D-erythritol kinase